MWIRAGWTADSDREWQFDGGCQYRAFVLVFEWSAHSTYAWHIGDQYAFRNRDKGKRPRLREKAQTERVKGQRMGTTFHSILSSNFAFAKREVAGLVPPCKDVPQDFIDRIKLVSVNSTPKSSDDHPVIRGVYHVV
jgi:hypothetical protein